MEWLVTEFSVELVSPEPLTEHLSDMLRTRRQLGDWPSGFSYRQGTQSDARGNEKLSG
jgi:hypothetical protein